MATRSDEGPVLGPGALHSASLITFIVGAVVAWNLWKTAGGAADPDHARHLSLLILGVCSLPVLITIVQVRRLFRSLGRAQLTLPYDNLPLGFAGTVTYLRPLRGATIRDVEARLQCEEQVIKGSGKNQRTVRAVVYDQPLTSSIVPMTDQLRIGIPLRIPPSGPHSLDHRTAKIEWWLRLRLRTEGCPNTRSSFKLDVLPASVPR